MLDLKVENGTLVIPGKGYLRAGVGIKDGEIVSIGLESGLPPAKRTIDAQGQYVLPGVVEPHVHFGIFTDFADECRTESRAALAGGVTTIGAFQSQAHDDSKPESWSKVLDDMIKVVEDNISTDLMLHLAINTPTKLAEIPEYARRFGVTSFKFHMWAIHGLTTWAVTEAHMLEAFRKIADLGSPAIACVHAEEPSMVDVAMERMKETMPQGGTLADWADTHPPEAEEMAIATASLLAEMAGCRLYIVHVTSKEGVRRLRQIKERNKNVYGEALSTHLSVSKYAEIGFLAKMNPPFRDQADIEALWEGVRDDTIDTFATDQVAHSKASKKADEGLWGSKPGYAASGTHLAVLLHEGYHKRGIPLTKIVEKAAQAPAQIHGIYPQKGTIAIGSDADLVLVDLDKEVTVNHANLHSFSDFSLYDGQTLKGWPTMTIKGGVVAVENNEIKVEPGSGRYLRRALRSG